MTHGQQHGEAGDAAAGEEGRGQGGAAAAALGRGAGAVPGHLVRRGEDGGRGGAGGAGQGDGVPLLPDEGGALPGAARGAALRVVRAAGGGAGAERGTVDGDAG